MKNSPDKPSRRRKLVVRRETIVELTRPQLAKVMGGDDILPCTYFSGCHPTTGCAG